MCRPERSEGSGGLPTLWCGSAAAAWAAADVGVAATAARPSTANSSIACGLPSSSTVKSSRVSPASGRPSLSTTSALTSTRRVFARKVGWPWAPAATVMSARRPAVELQMSDFRAQILSEACVLPIRNLRPPGGLRRGRYATRGAREAIRRGGLPRRGRRRRPQASPDRAAGDRTKAPRRISMPTR